MLNLRVMRALIKTQKRPSRRELILMVAVFGLLSFLSISALIIGAQKKTNRDLKKAGAESELKVADLQKDLENIGKTLSGLKIKNEGAENEGGVQAPETSNLRRIAMVATPGETVLNIDIPEGWESVGENRLRHGKTTVAVQSEDLDLLTIPNYKVDRVIDSFVLKSGQPVFLIFIKTTEENRGYLSLSFCNPETGSACSYRGKDGKFVFILAHGYEDKDQFVRDMDFNTADGILLLNDFKVMMKSLQLN
jgi:hypothetical protein